MPRVLSKLLVSTAVVSSVPPSIPSITEQVASTFRPMQESDVLLGQNLGKREIVMALFRAGAIGFMTFYIVRWILRFADPTYQQKQKAKTKAKEIMDRLGVKNLTLNEHEVMIASHLVDPNHLKISWADIAGLDEQIEQIKKTVIYPVLAHQRIVRVSRLIQPPKGILLYGPPGCGKTLIAKAMAKESKCWFINLDVSVLTDKWYGESQKLTAAVFTLAEKLQPCIIFIDEIDSLLRLRATQDHEVTAMMKAQFMSLWDGLITDPHKTVIVMGATNRPKDMDSAILRRMAAKFHIPIPDINQRKHILDLTLKQEVVDSDFNLDRLAQITDGFSGSDLKEVARSAAVACLADLQLSRDCLWERHGSSKSNKSVSSNDSQTAVDDTSSSSVKSVPEKGSWFKSLWSSRSSDHNNMSCSSSSLGHDNMAIRPITMRDFEGAVNKAKEARAHCQAQQFRQQRIELD
ncbi:unnamed protein product [Orchesella dallaii]|uniref:AAA+ ATPase domain-containing protein n=1 Tax=Orchesella dallaii TaxID=48710 RepID=A0ABP1R0W5_9HEXA